MGVCVLIVNFLINWFWRIKFDYFFCEFMMMTLIFDYFLFFCFLFYHNLAEIKFWEIFVFKLEEARKFLIISYLMLYQLFYVYKQLFLAFSFFIKCEFFLTVILANPCLRLELVGSHRLLLTLNPQLSVLMCFPIGLMTIVIADWSLRRFRLQHLAVMTIALRWTVRRLDCVAIS